jgi:hypothetical protein
MSFFGLIACLLFSSCGNENLPDALSTISSECVSNTQLSLNRAILTSDDMIKEYPTFETEKRWIESVDLTNEIMNQNGCSLDCAKLNWLPTKVEITLIEKDLPTETNELILETRSTFTNILELTDRPSLLNLASNAWAAYNYSQHEFVLLYSYGSIFVSIKNRPAFGFDDFAGEFDLTYAIGKTQNEKLCISGYEP